MFNYGFFYSLKCGFCLLIELIVYGFSWVGGIESIE